MQNNLQENNKGEDEYDEKILDIIQKKREKNTTEFEELLKYNDIKTLYLEKLSKDERLKYITHGCIFFSQANWDVFKGSEEMKKILNREGNSEDPNAPSIMERFKNSFIIATASGVAYGECKFNADNLFTSLFQYSDTILSGHPYDDDEYIEKLLDLCLIILIDAGFSKMNYDKLRKMTPDKRVNSSLRLRLGFDAGFGDPTGDIMKKYETDKFEQLAEARDTRLKGGKVRETSYREAVSSGEELATIIAEDLKSLLESIYIPEEDEPISTPDMVEEVVTSFGGKRKTKRKHSSKKRKHLSKKRKHLSKKRKHSSKKRKHSSKKRNRRTKKRKH